jgi:sugar lactone lactonase YvrE
MPELKIGWRAKLSLACTYKSIVLANLGDSCGECPLWHSEKQTLYWTDIAQKKLHAYSWPDRRHRMIYEGLEISGIALHHSSGFVIVNSGGVWIWKPEAEPQLVVDQVEDSRCALNDCIADPEGRLFTGSCFYDSSVEKYERGCLFRIDSNGAATIVDEGFGISNGLGFSPDCSTLYFADSAERIIYAYEYRRSDGSIRNRREFVKTSRDEGLPDGLTVDRDGFVWSAQWFGGCVVRYDPDGCEHTRISLPVTQTSSIAFGGPALRTIFVTSAGIPDALQLAPRGYSADTVKPGGQLYSIQSEFCGRPEYLANIVPPPS